METHTTSVVLQDKVWTITKGDEAVTIHCNGVAVLNYLYTDGTYGGSSANCVEKMGRNVDNAALLG